jgi:hypothetical protein
VNSILLRLLQTRYNPQGEQVQPPIVNRQGRTVLTPISKNWEVCQAGQRYHRDLELRLKIVEKDRTSPLAYRTPKVKDHRRVAPIALRSPAGLTTQHTRTTATAPMNNSMAYLGFWLRSGKNLDFCLLAVCSCVLSLLCHQTITSLPFTLTATNSSTAPTAPLTNFSRVDLMIKAGLFTTSTKVKEEKD